MLRNGDYGVIFMDHTEALGDGEPMEDGSTVAELCISCGRMDLPELRLQSQVALDLYMIFPDQG